MVAKSNKPELVGDKELSVTRVFDAPRELVFEAWTNPKHLVHWWGPRGFHNTSEKIDLRPGGVWLFVMHGPDGRDYPNKIVFEEIVRPERLTYIHPGDEGEAMLFRVFAAFKDLGGKTELLMRLVFPNAVERDRALKEYGAQEGLDQTMDKLGEYVDSLNTQSKEKNMANGKSAEEFVISRTFNAPRDLVWKAQSEAERLAQWWGPKGFSFKIGKLDFRKGGIFHYGMTAPNGVMMWGKITYLEIVPQEKIVSIVSFSDEKGGITRHPMSPTWPLETLSNATFTEKDGKTTLTLRWSAYNASEEETKIFNSSYASMEQGFKGTWDQLEEYLGKAGK